MSASLTINLKRPSKVYHEGETICGVVLVESSSELRHEGLSLQLEGCATLHFSAKNTGILDAFSNNIKPVVLASTCIELCPAGRLPPGATPLAFELPLRPRASAQPLLETYHGVFVNVTYSLRAHMKRQLFSKPLSAASQFFVQYRHQEPPPLKPVRCEITPASIRAGSGGSGGVGGAAAGGGAGAGGRANMPHFQIYAEIDSTVCALDKPLTGKIRVDECSATIKSVELQLVRVETCGCADGFTRDATEVQNIQVGEGDVVRSRDLPLHMVLPRLFTCPTTATPHFKIEFELNIAVIFEDDYLITENFPILLLRCR